jgi:2-C-methyl-D-erythritol 4-phosphate cytidylyltransferase
MRMVAVVLAGGLGQRFGAEVPKQLLRLDGRTLIEHCVAAFDQAPGVDEILVVMPPGRTADAEKLLASAGGVDGPGYRKVTGVIEGGVARPDSTRRAIAAISARQAGRADQDSDCGVLLHDAARPLVDQRIIADCVRALRDADAVGVTVPASDTIVVATDGVMTGMPRRDSLLRCQTPQAFRLSVIARAHELARADPEFIPTDDCGVVLRYLPEVPVRVVAGSEHNIKVTYPRDLAIAEVLLKTDGAAGGRAPGVSSAAPA